MAIGDKAAAKGWPLVDGNAADSAREVDDYINETRDIAADVMDASAPLVHTHTMADITDLYPIDVDVSTGSIARRTVNGRLLVGTPVGSTDAATKGYVDAAVAGGSGLADGPTSAAYNRNAVGSGWFAVYMNSALQFMRNTSARRYKKNIRDWAGSTLGLRTVIFDRRGEDTPNDEVGFIAEEVGETLPEAVVYFDEKVDGINDRAIIAALVADVQRLNARITELEGGNRGD